MRRCPRFLSLFSVMLAACTSLTSPKNGVAVSIHGVNYTDRPFRYVLVDPKDSTNTGGGEHIGPFGSGGITCCYSLPKQWTPGIQVQVLSTHWERFNANGKMPEIVKVHTVEVPRYVGENAGELWVLRTKEGTIELVSSDVQPNHPDWPGKVRGWPEPSLEYQRERWKIYKETAEIHIRNYRKLLDELDTAPRTRSQKAWESAQAHRSNEIKLFKGPDDPAYVEFLKVEYTNGLKGAETRLLELVKGRP